jgi:predicted solute-binding protein
MPTSCPYCGSDEIANTLNVKEMMLGTEEIFEYQRCAQCATLRIGNIPNDLGRYYSDGYYSFETNRVGVVKFFFQVLRDASNFGGGGGNRQGFGETEARN